MKTITYRWSSTPIYITHHKWLPHSPLCLFCARGTDRYTVKKMRKASVWQQSPLLIPDWMKFQIKYWPWITVCHLTSSVLSPLLTFWFVRPFANFSREDGLRASRSFSIEIMSDVADAIRIRPPMFNPGNPLWKVISSLQKLWTVPSFAPKSNFVQNMDFALHHFIFQ